MSFIGYPQLNSNKSLWTPWNSFSKRACTSQKLKRTFGQSSPSKSPNNSYIGQSSYLNVSPLNISSKFDTPSPISLSKKTTIFLNIPSLKHDYELLKPVRALHRPRRHTYLKPISTTPDPKIDKFIEFSSINTKKSISLVTQKIRIVHTSLMDYPRQGKTPKSKENNSISIDGKRINMH
ncbi:unnamed protein product [Blepharisma stoltei]|uniref:Uncharacterized protein n=1 Tax=Blepharisma stoltei TaxID=1481888 RepID=A0AAU9KAV0_9CILI|nr:unnamed protein product [Blepharisma stoltei]